MCRAFKQIVQITTVVGECRSCNRMIHGKICINSKYVKRDEWIDATRVGVILTCIQLLYNIVNV